MRGSRSVEFVGGGSSESFQPQSLTLSDMLQNRTMLHFFQKFLEQEYSEENLLFFLEVERFKALVSQEELQPKAFHIYSSYINPDTAQTLINLTQEVVAQIQLRLEPLLLTMGASNGATPEVDEKKKTARYDSLSLRLRKSLSVADFPLLVTPDLFDQASIGESSPD